MYLYFSSKNGQPREPVVPLCQLSRRTGNFSFLVLLEYTAQRRLCDYALYKSTIDIDIDISFTRLLIRKCQKALIEPGACGDKDVDSSRRSVFMVIVNKEILLLDAIRYR